MNEPRQLREGALLWQPSEAFKAASTMTDYMHWLERERGLRFADYAELWRWSVDDPAGFWSSLVDYYEIPLRGEWTEVLGEATMPGARWFDGAQLNYAEALLKRVVPDRPARSGWPTSASSSTDGWATCSSSMAIRSRTQRSFSSPTGSGW